MSCCRRRRSTSRSWRPHCSREHTTWRWSESDTDPQVNTLIYYPSVCFSSSLTLCFLTDISPPSIFHIPADHEPDKELTDWLKENGANADTIDKVDDETLEHLSMSHSQHGFLLDGFCVAVCAGRIQTDWHSQWRFQRWPPLSTSTVSTAVTTQHETKEHQIKLFLAADS